MRGQGLRGLRARLNDQIEILGDITCHIEKYVLEIADVIVEADVKYRGNFYPKTTLVVIEFMGDKSDDISINDKYPFISNLKEIKKFRELLSRALLEKAENTEDVPAVVSVGIQRFLEDLKKFDEFKAKKTIIKSRVDMLNEENSEDQQTLVKLFDVLGLIPGNERILVAKE